MTLMLLMINCCKVWSRLQVNRRWCVTHIWRVRFDVEWRVITVIAIMILLCNLRESIAGVFGKLFWHELYILLVWVVFIERLQCYRGNARTFTAPLLNVRANPVIDSRRQLVVLVSRVWKTYPSDGDSPWIFRKTSKEKKMRKPKWLAFLEAISENCPTGTHDRD